MSRIVTVTRVTADPKQATRSLTLDCGHTKIIAAAYIVHYCGSATRCHECKEVRQ